MKITKILMFPLISLLLAGTAFADFSICPDEPGWHVCGPPDGAMSMTNKVTDHAEPALISETTAQTNISLLNGSDTADDTEHQSTALASLPEPDLAAGHKACGSFHKHELGWQS